MEKRIVITALVWAFVVLSAHSQWSKQDSIKLEKFLSGEAPLRLNEEAIKSIRFGLPDNQLPPTLQPILSDDKPSLKFRNDLPDVFTDSLAKHRAYLTLIPYNIHTRYDEDPIHMPNNIFTSSFLSKMNFNKPFDIRMQRVSAGRHSGSPAGVGVSFSFSMEDVLQRLFSKKGRARLRNAKNAKAWKTY